MFQFPANPTLGQLFEPVPGTIYSFDGTGWVLAGEVAVGGQFVLKTGDTMTGPLRFADGSTVLPAISWASEPTAGFWKTNPQTFASVVDGKEVFSWNKTVFALGGETPGTEFLARGLATFNGIANFNSTANFGAGMWAGGGITLPNSSVIQFGNAGNAAYWEALHGSSGNGLHVGRIGWVSTSIYGGGQQVRVDSAGFNCGTITCTGHVNGSYDIIASRNMQCQRLTCTDVVGTSNYYTNNGAGYYVISQPSGGYTPVIHGSGANCNVGDANWGCIQLICAGTTRAAVTTSGYFKAYGNVGATYTGAAHEFNTHIDGGEYCLFVRNGGGNGSCLSLNLPSQGDNATYNYLQCNNGGGQRMVIWSNTGIYNNAANNVSWSDATVKQNIVPSPDYTAFVEQLQYRNFSYVDDPTYTTDDVIAQELAELDEGLVSAVDGRLGVYSHRLQQRINSVIPKLLERIRLLEEKVFGGTR